MQLVYSPAELRIALRKRQRDIVQRDSTSLGLVPTMGSLHAGHGQLIRRARAENASVALSLFVNPLQFGPHEDFAAYPRDLNADMRVAEDAGVDILFAPSVSQMYPSGFASRISVESVSGGFDGAVRPGHFTGVATVVLKLLNLMQPNRAYFGEKDWQQLAVVRRMVRDLDVPVDIVGVPTVRSELPGELGLALSSRNSYLSAEQRARAAVLARALRAAQQRYTAGERRSRALLSAASAELASEAGLTLDYLALVDSDMNEREWVDTEGVSAESLAQYRLLVAARLFGVRLIDNMPLLPADVLPAAL